MFFALQHTLQLLVTTYFVPLMGLFMTAAVILASIGKFRDKRMENIIEASTTWRELADSREAEIKEKDKEIADLEDDNKKLRRRNEYLWGQLNPANKTSQENEQ